MLRTVVLVSGGGTNLQAILDAVDEGTVTNTQIVEVISNNAGAYALERAAQKQIPGKCISPKAYDSREEFHEALLEELKQCRPDLIVLAGFLVAIPPVIVDAFPNKIINIHPSLIPSFCGVGYYGLRVHQAVLDRGVKVTGATVHFVDAGTDTGPILLQKSVEVHSHDTAQILQKRVMEEAEWKILPQAIHLIANNRVKVEGHKAEIIQ